MRKLLFLVFFLFSLILVPRTLAQNNSFISVVNPVRGNDFWDLKDQKPETAVIGQSEILNKFGLSATWLIRFDALEDKKIIEAMKDRLSDEKGLFLEVTPAWTTQANVEYHQSGSWHAAGSAFLTGYERDEREKLIDTAFIKFKSIFGYFPSSAGAWWIDGYSLGYMQKKYGLSAALIVSDQYSTDNYQIWGQYFSTPYYPSKKNALHPAQSLENKLDVVIMQWAPRDPVNSYGNGVMESTFSVQANDYIDYHNLDTKYFSTLIDVYIKQKFNKFSQLVVGLENSYKWSKYSDEYQKQIKVLSKKRNSGELAIISLKDFAGWYKSSFPKLSPEQLIIADDPLGGVKKSIWYMNPYYRAGWFYNLDGSVLRDIRQYIDGEEELCSKSRCDSVNFATSATRVLDEVSFGHKWIIDQGKISDLEAERKDEEFILSYKNEAGNLRKIGFLPRDISIDGKIFSIDGAILNVTKKEDILVYNTAVSESFLNWSFVSVTLKICQFVIFLIFAIILPGFVLTNKVFNKDTSVLLRLFVSATAGLVVLTLLFYISSLFHIKPVIFVYFLINFIIFFRFKFYDHLVNLPAIKSPSNLIPVLLILMGTAFQAIPTFKSGLNFSYGLGFWGPNTHDGIWHIALVNQLIKSVPPENPIYSAVVLKNYHFFYDLFIAATNYFSKIPVGDLIFRFYPILFSLMLGIGSYYLVIRLFNNKTASLFSLYLVYFAGSFGWIVEFLRERHFGGESAFWANQSVSFNLNPPFAVSLVIIVALIHIIFSRPGNFVLTVILAGSLIGFKSYGAVLFLISILLIGIIKRQIPYVFIFIGAAIISAGIFLPNFDTSSSLLILAPFWFIHAMIDSPDRVGWTRITLMREAGFITSNWLKISVAEILSLLLFIAGNLGLRVISLLSLIKIKGIIKDEKLLFIFIFAFLSFLIPILFIQSGNPWNTIQFSYYGLYMAAIISGEVLVLIIIRLPKYAAVLIVPMVIILAPINSAVTAIGYLGQKPHAFVPSKELEALQFLSNQPDGAVLTYPYNSKLKQKISEPWPILAYDSTAYVAALSKKSVYLEDEPQNLILLTDYKKRVVASKDFFLKPITESTKFLQDNKIKYIYLPKIHNVRLDESAASIKNIFENEKVVIYEANI